eukprot:TRINITY_DN149_c0_g1_i17.p1 TRINITY_DN149_c0_g1~~TRINITY_DN149_c0_g1_i17.p1  ORF type:complete len:242 (-),score=25.92 TRINITY_DN149_c0_g1_i17:31-756(-)
MYEAVVSTQSTGEHEVLLMYSVGLLTGLVAVGGVVYWYYRNQPSLEQQFCLAFQRNDLITIKRLACIIQDVDKIRFSDGVTPLMQSLRDKNIDSTQTLLPFSNVTVVDDNLWTPLHVAVFNQASAEIVQSIIGKGADIQATDVNCWTPLLIASSLSSLSLCRILISEGANVNCQNVLGQTPIFIASNNGCSEIVILLLKNNADPTIRTNKTLSSPLHVASYHKSLEIVRLLLTASPYVRVI